MSNFDKLTELDNYQVQRAVAEAVYAALENLKVDLNGQKGIYARRVLDVDYLRPTADRFDRYNSMVKTIEKEKADV